MTCFPITRRGFLCQAGLTATAVAALSSSAEEPKPAAKLPDAVERYLQGIYAEGNQKYTFRADYAGGFKQWQADARPLLQELLGLGNIARHAKVHTPTIELGEAKDRGSHTIRRGTIETEPNVRIPFWLLRPKGDGPFPLAIMPHGHDRRGHDSYAGVYHDQAHRQQSLAIDRDVAVQAVERGFLAIAPAVRGLATEANGVPDSFGRHGDRDCRSHLLHCILAGRTAVGERVWDMSRLIDWASELKEVDASRLLMMGNSGGGMVTMYAAACDTRITVAVPSCSFTVIASRQGRIFHCDCNAIPGILKWGDLYDVVGLAAPRYVLAVTGRHDTLHSATAIEHAAARTRAIYQAAGAADHFQHRWGEKGHQFYKELMWPFVMQAIKKT